MSNYQKNTDLNDKTHLNERLESEKEFHDSKYSGKTTIAPHYQFNPTYHIFLKMKELLGDIEGKRILEYGCGTGWITAELASLGGAIDAFDISQEGINQTKSLLHQLKMLGCCTLKKMAAEELEYDANTFDFVTGFAILHHLDLDKAMPELYRVLKPSGVAYFAEPLGVNPLINLYRLLTPKYRTEDERPIIFKDFKKYSELFSSFTHEEFYLTALLPMGLLYLPYVKKYFNSVLNSFIKIDRVILKTIPWLGNWAWYSIFCLKK
jgi:ubiquinone/menaquinone biosynthesis C-methylase UbiE